MQVYVGDTCHRPGMQQQHAQTGQWGSNGGYGAAAGSVPMGGGVGSGGGGGSGYGGGGTTTIHKTMANVTVLGEYDGGARGEKSGGVYVCPLEFRCLSFLMETVSLRDFKGNVH